MEKPQIRATGKPNRARSQKQKSDKTTLEVRRKQCEQEDFNSTKKMMLLPKDRETVDFLDAFCSIETFLKSLKTFNVTDTSSLRETEKRKVLELIHSNFTHKSDKEIVNSTMIIFGQPGLGKTLLVHEIMNNLEAEKYSYVSRELGISADFRSMSFECIYLNAMNFNNCFEFIGEFLAKIDQKVHFFKKDEKSKINSVVKIEIFLNKLPKLLRTHKFIVLIDELETLSQNDKSNFHHLMQILNLKKPGFVNICISNTLNLFSSLNGNSLYLNFEYLIFKPYTEENLLSILKARLTKEKTTIGFEEILPLPALNFIVKKTFKNTSSDVRFILTITQNIIENKQIFISKLQAEQKPLYQKDLQISFPEILDAFNQKLCGDWASIIQKLNFQTQVLLLAVCQNIEEINQTVSLVS